MLVDVVPYLGSWLRLLPSSFFVSAAPSSELTQARRHEQQDYASSLKPLLAPEVLAELKAWEARVLSCFQPCPEVHDPFRVLFEASGVHGVGGTYQIAAFGIQGRPKDKAEDFTAYLDLLHLPAFQDCSRACFACVLDGHGGTGAVQYVARHFPARLLQRLEALREQPCKTMRKALEEVDEALLQEGHNSGTTVCALLLVDNTCTVLNTGDCRLVKYDIIDETWEQVTQDHNTKNCNELSRVQSLGAALSSDAEYIILTHADGTSQDLGVTKALGHASVKSHQRQQLQMQLQMQASADHAACPQASTATPPTPSALGGPLGSGAASVTSSFHDALVSAPSAASSSFMLEATPDEFTFEVVDNRHFLVIGCDGLFERMANGELCRAVRRELAAVTPSCPSPADDAALLSDTAALLLGEAEREEAQRRAALQRAAAEAARRAVKRSHDLGSMDNISALVMRFGNKPWAIKRSCSVLNFKRSTNSGSVSDLPSAGASPGPKLGALGAA